MQSASQKYKEVKAQKYVDQVSHMRISIGVVNQEAQSTATVTGDGYEYYSELTKPLNNYTVDPSELYVACDQNYTKVDSQMFFLPREKEMAVLNQGIVTHEILGTIRIDFPVAYDLKGLTVDFGEMYPVDFVVESDHQAMHITGNAESRWTTDEVFEGVTYLLIKPSKMLQGQNKLRIHQIIMGAGIYFSSREIKTATKKEYVSPISEELPTLDFTATVTNKDRKWDIENTASAVNYLQAGQEIEALYGQELTDGSIEWLPGIALQLTEWSVDDEEMSFSATDRFDGMTGTYYRGIYRSEGITLYDLAVDVFADAGIDPRTYWLDPYLKNVRVYNPMPVVKHKEALQLIANAGRCIITQGRNGNIYMKSSFAPDMTVQTEDAAYYSQPDKILTSGDKSEYAISAPEYTRVDSQMFFLPREQEGVQYLETGYISAAITDASGNFVTNPQIEISAEAAYKCFGMQLSFGRLYPGKVKLTMYLADVLQEELTVDAERVTTISREFPEWDRLQIEFQNGKSYSPVILDSITFGDSTDYELTYANLMKTPKGKQLQKVKELQIMRTLYGEGQVADVELAREKISISSADNQYTFYFSNASYGLSCSIVEPEAGQSIRIIDSSNYYAIVEITGITEPVELEAVVMGREYILSYTKVIRQLHTTGTLETWSNPLVSELIHAADLADWIGDYLQADREYELSYRGEARIDANDLIFLENKYVENMQVRISEHQLTYNGALSGTIKARRVE
jgi:hypothetical protein